MSIRINERWKHNQGAIELFDKAKNRYAEITIQNNGNILEYGDPTLIKIFKQRKLNYTSVSDYKFNSIIKKSKQHSQFLPVLDEK